jgi:CheY-like chemotaxis protein
MSTNRSDSPVEILLVEDDSADVQLAEEGLRAGGVPSRLWVVEDGIEALAFLRRQGRYANAVRPDLILLDLKMPKLGGLGVLAEIKAEPSLRRIPVVVLTTSDAPEDILRAYDLQASSYITKPPDLKEFQRVMRAITEYCLTVVKLPPHG